MDIATLVGLVGAFVLIVLAIDDTALFVNPPSLLIVVGGSIMVVLMRSSLAEFIGAVKVAMKAFKGKVDTPEELIKQLVNLGTIARKDGMIALEGEQIANPFLAKAVGMLVDGTDQALIRQALERENEIMQSRHSMGASVFSDWGEVAPAMGMIGTLIGLVQMLAAMDDPKAIGPAMAIALLTTMYGAILANVICIPISKKLANKSALEAHNNELIIQGVMFIQEGGNPRLLSDLLSSFVTPKARGKLAEAMQ